MPWIFFNAKNLWKFTYFSFGIVEPDFRNVKPLRGPLLKYTKQIREKNFFFSIPDFFTLEKYNFILHLFSLWIKKHLGINDFKVFFVSFCRGSIWDKIQEITSDFLFFSLQKFVQHKRKIKEHFYIKVFSKKGSKSILANYVSSEHINDHL